MSLNLYALLCDGLDNESLALEMEQTCPTSAQQKKRVRRVDAELNELQEQLQRKAQELQRAEAESQRLRQRLKLLETVLPVREQQIRLLQSEAAQPQPSNGAGTVPAAARQRLTITELTPSDSDASSSDMGLSSGGGGSSMAVSVSSEGGRYLLDERGQVVLVPQAPPHGSAHEVMQKFMAIWNRDVREAALLLAAHDVRPHDPAPAMRLEQLQDQNWPLLCAMWKHYPSLLTDVCRLNMDTGRVEDPPPGHWAAVVTGLRPTAEQRASCLSALDLYRERMGPALQERRSLAHALSAALEQADGQRAAAASGQSGQQQQLLQGPAGWGAHGGMGSAAGCSGGSGGSGKDVTLEFMCAAQSLQRNLDMEAKALGMINDFIGAGVFSVVQMKRISVLSHPFFPDVLAVLTAVEELERQGGPPHKQV